MNKYLITFLLLVGVLAFGQNTNPENWNWLLGKWEGKGEGKPGEGGGTFSFEKQLDNKIIVRKSHSEYVAENKSKVVHDDLMIIYPDQTKAIYFDNEGHVIEYKISYADKSIILISEKMENSPVFKLTYTLLKNKEINTSFEFSQDGKSFVKYIEGKSIKVN